jgi:hypothetical protein
MVFSTQKPAKIVILSTQDDIRNSKCTVRYAFRFAIQEATQTEVTYDEQGNPVEQTIQGWQYEEVVSTMTIELFMKPALPQILEAAYNSTVPTLEQNLQLAQTPIPPSIE